MNFSNVERLHSEKLDYALSYASRGWRVHPLYHVKVDGNCSCNRYIKSQAHKKGKHPRLRKWQKKATTNPSQIRKWWTVWPDANIGIVCGKESNLLVIDVDFNNGGEKSLKQAFVTYPDLEVAFNTYSVKTGAGRHFYYQYEEGIRNSNGTTTLGKGIDIRAESGYVVAPPSNHVSGNLYEYQGGEVNPIPEILIGLLKDSKINASQEMVVPEGQRNTTLTTLAIDKHRNGLPRNKLETYLLEENATRCKPPLNTDEVLSIVKSITKGSSQSLKTIWQIAVTRSQILSDKRKIILLNLSHYMDADGRNCFPTQDQMEDDLGITRKTIGNHLKEAASDGWITPYPRPSTKHHGRNYGYIAQLPNG